MVGLMATSFNRAYAICRSAAPRTPAAGTTDLYLHRRHSDTVLTQSLWVGLAFCALPMSEQLRRIGAWWAHCPRWALCLNDLPGPATWFPGCSTRAPFQVCCISPLESYLRLQASWRVWTIQDLRKTSAKTRPGADCGSDHELPIAKFRLKLKKVRKTTRPFRYDLYLIPYDYTVEVRNRFKG